MGSSARSASTIKTHLGYWNEYHGELSVASACAYTQQKAFTSWLEGQSLKPATINHVLKIGGAAIRHAWKRGELESVPHIQLVKMTKQPPMGKPLSPQECAALLNESSGHVHDFIKWAVGTAARPEAVLQLTYDRVDIERRRIDLNPPERLQNKKYRPVVRLPSFLGGGDGFVIAFKGKQVKSLKTAWRKARERARVGEGVTLYSFRHTIGRHMREEGVPLEQIQRQLGHSSAKVTDRYAPYAPDYLIDACAAIESFYQRVKSV